MEAWPHYPDALMISNMIAGTAHPCDPTEQNNVDILVL